MLHRMLCLIMRVRGWNRSDRGIHDSQRRRTEPLSSMNSLRTSHTATFPSVACQRRLRCPFQGNGRTFRTAILTYSSKFGGRLSLRFCRWYAYIAHYSLWRPLYGPNDDWPLSVCDFTSIEGDDILNTDNVHPDRAVENSLLHRNDAHRWYYVAGQRVEDLIVFRIVDSTGKRARKQTLHAGNMLRIIGGEANSSNRGLPLCS